MRRSWMLPLRAPPTALQSASVVLSVSRGTGASWLRAAVAIPTDACNQ